VGIRNSPTLLPELTNLFKVPVKFRVRLRCGLFVFFYGIVNFMRQGCVELLGLYVTPYLFLIGKRIEFE